MRVVSFALLLFFFGCSNATTGTDGGGDTMTAEERAGFDVGAPSTPAAVQLTALTDKLFKFDPTIDTAQTALQNAQNVVTEIQKNLGAAGDGGTACGSVSLMGTTVTASFGAPPGCTLGNLTVSGTIAISVNKIASSITLAVTFTSVTVNGELLSGMATFATSNGTTFTLNANVTWQKTTYIATGFTVTGAVGSITLDGALSVMGDAATSLTFAGVLWKQGDCYPSAGTLTIKKATLTETITFSAASATTGQVTVTIGKKTVPGQLPAYGKCGAKDGG